MKIKLILAILVLTLLFLLGCQKAVEDTTSENYSPYQVCESEESGEKIYELTWCGDDTCWNKFYDADGNLLEETEEMGPGTPRQYEIKTKVANCSYISLPEFVMAIPGKDTIQSASKVVLNWDSSLQDCGVSPNGEKTPEYNCLYQAYLTCTPAKMELRNSTDAQFKELLVVTKEKEGCKVGWFQHSFEYNATGFSVCDLKAGLFDREMRYYMSECNMTSFFQ